MGTPDLELTLTDGSAILVIDYCLRPGTYRNIFHRKAGSDDLHRLIMAKIDKLPTALDCLEGLNLSDQELSTIKQVFYRTA